jgi:hypothetical protein
MFTRFSHSTPTVSILTLIFCVPTFVHAQVTLVSILDAITASIGAFVAVGVGLALALFIWGIVGAIYQTKSDVDVAASRKKMLWGLFALTLIVSLWGAVRILQNIVGVADSDTDCRYTSINSDMTIESCY